LQDHRYCEGKAASSARAFARRYGHKWPSLATEMEALAREEDAHFELCTRLLKERGGAPANHHGNPYIALLRRRVNRAGGGTELDQLVVAAFIEARSAERFRLLADDLQCEPLGRVYEDLFASESRHHALFVRLAADLFGSPAAHRRIEAVSRIEGEIVAARPWGAFLH